MNTKAGISLKVVIQLEGNNFCMQFYDWRLDLGPKTNEAKFMKGKPMKGY